MKKIPPQFKLSEDYDFVPACNGIQHPVLIHTSCLHKHANNDENAHYIVNWVDFTRFWPSAKNHNSCNLCSQLVPSDVLKKAKFILSGKNND